MNFEEPLATVLQRIAAALERLATAPDVAKLSRT